MHKLLNISNKISITILVLISLLLGNAKYNQHKKQKALDTEIQTLIAQTKEKTEKNKELETTLNYLNSPEFKERIARQQLNLKKEGEIVFNFTENKSEIAQNDLISKYVSAKPNYEKWLEYFFGK